MNHESTIELRSDGGSGKLTLEGYASTFGVWYPIGVGVEEKMRPQSFKRSLAESPAVALRVEHSALPLAHTKSGTLELSEDRTGLLTVASLNERDPDVQGLQAKAENSPLQMSFAFRCNKDSWNEDRSRREVIEAGLHKGDVSIVCYGANEATGLSIDARAGASSLEQRRRFAERIRGYTGGPRWGFTADDARAMFDMQPAEQPRGRSQIAVPSYLPIAKARRAKLRGGRVKPAATSATRARPAPTGRYSVERAKAARAKARRGHPGSGASVDGEEDAPRYTETQVTKLGEEGKAYKKRDGTYSYPVADRRDLLNAVQAWGRAKASEAAAVKQFIKARARLLRLESLLPESWQTKAKQKLHPKEEE